MQFSLIVIHKKLSDGMVDGVWLQDCVATTLENAILRARSTEKVNSNRIDIAVVDRVNSYIPNYSMLYNLKRLD